LDEKNKERRATKPWGLNKLRLRISIRGWTLVQTSDAAVIAAVQSSAYSIGIEGEVMKGLRLGTNFTVFLLFFGVATIEAFQTRNWIKGSFWLAIGVVFLMTDNSRRVA
jgi:hypothetical protein